MIKTQRYVLSEEEYKYFYDATMHIYCPDLTDHNCSLCPMNINIYHNYPKEPEHRCLIGMMEYALSNIKRTEGEL